MMTKLRSAALAMLGALLLWSACVTTAGAALPGLDSKMNETVVMISADPDRPDFVLETTIYKPPGAGPFPLLIMNHGKSKGNAHLQERARYTVVSREFVRRGYAVIIPMRAGFSNSSGKYSDPSCNLERNGLQQANSVAAALAYARQQPWADPERIIVAGQSHGGLTALALASRNVAGVKGIINFAGGLRKEANGCRWEDSLVHAFGVYGASTHVPSLWFYGANDELFGPELAARMHAAYTAAGGQAQLVAYGPFKNNAHGMSASRDGVAIWWPPTERFLQSLQMPTEVAYQLVSADPHPKTGFAALENVDAVPYLREKGRDGYRKFLGELIPRAFAISSSGAWAWAVDGDDPGARALATCQKNSNTRCRLYAVDDDVVWKE